MFAGVSVMTLSEDESDVIGLMSKEGEEVFIAFIDIFNDCLDFTCFYIILSWH